MMRPRSLVVVLALLAGCMGEDDLDSRVGKPCVDNPDCACEGELSDCEGEFVCLHGTADGLCVRNDPELCDIAHDDGVLVTLESQGASVLDEVKPLAEEAGYVCALGDLTLEGADITSVPGASYLTTLAGSLLVEGTGLTGLSELGNLELVRDNVALRDNPRLEELGLSSRLTVGGNLEIRGNATLPEAAAQAFVSRVCHCGGGVAGEIRVCGNGALPTGCNLPSSTTRCADVPAPMGGCP